MSNGGWVSSACTAIRKITKTDELGDDVRVADPIDPEDRPLAWADDDALHVEGAGLDHHADHGEDQRQLVGDQLAGGAQPPISAYLLADAQPAIRTPIVDTDDTAST
jgi:hypothetical protein